MSIVSARVSEVVRLRHLTWGAPPTAEVLNNNLFNYEDTYMVVFGPTQQCELILFEEKFKGKLLFKGKPASNTNHRGSGPRNTLIIFEMEGHTYDA